MLAHPFSELRVPLQSQFVPLRWLFWDTVQPLFWHSLSCFLVLSGIRWPSGLGFLLFYTSWTGVKGRIYFMSNGVLIQNRGMWAEWGCWKWKHFISEVRENVSVCEWAHLVFCIIVSQTVFVLYTSIDLLVRHKTCLINTKPETS